MADGRWQMADGRWQMADGGWRMADGRWRMADGNVGAGVAISEAAHRYQRSRKPAQPLRARMRAFVHSDQLPVIQMRVLLRRRERRVTEELLNRAKVGAGVEKVGGERMAHGVRRDSGAQRGFAEIAVEQASHAARGDAAAAIVDEERLLFGIVRQLAALREIRAQRGFRLRSKRHDPLLRSLAVHFHEARAQLQIVEIDSDDFADAQP